MTVYLDGGAPLTGHGRERTCQWAHPNNLSWDPTSLHFLVGDFGRPTALDWGPRAHRKKQSP